MRNIKGFLEASFIDWPGRVCAVLFLGNCNFRCPFCHNHSLVLEPESFESIELDFVRNRLNLRKKWLGGVCITGGEPTLNPGLTDAVVRLKEDGWAVKLDTNGNKPGVLRRLLADGLLDMVSMDVKAPLNKEKYERCAGVAVDLDTIRESISLLKASSIDHEFRMTVLPRFHSMEDVRSWAGSLGGAYSRLTLQNFNPHATLDSKLASAQSFSEKKFSELQQMVA